MINFRILSVLTLSVLFTTLLALSYGTEAQAFATPGDLRVGIVFYCDDEDESGDLFNTLVDDGRFNEVTLIDGVVFNPGAQELARDFDCVLTYTNDDFTNCPMDPTMLFNEASEAMAGYVQLGGGLVLTSFVYSAGTLGFGPAIFGPGLSPFQQVQNSNGMSGPVDIDGASTTPPACGRMLEGVGPINAGPNNVVNLSEDSSLCASYDNGELFLAVNSTGRVIGLNSFPALEGTLAQESFRLLVSNAVFEACTATEARPIPTMSEWLMIAMAGVLGILGLIALRRRNAAA